MQLSGRLPPHKARVGHTLGVKKVSLIQKCQGREKRSCPRCRRAPDSNCKLWVKRTLSLSGRLRVSCHGLRWDAATQIQEEVARPCKQRPCFERALFLSSLGLQLCSGTLALEVSVGKAAVIHAKNGTSVLLPCTFNSCIGIEKANFSWSHNQTEIFKGVIRNKDSKPEPYAEYKFSLKHMLPPDLALSKDNREFNVSLLLLDADFEDSGPYTCLVKNPKEKDANHSGTFTLKVVVAWSAL
ncbi:sodium channel regulatory subunit beta-4 isoform 2-T2 [Liasis olivaceus]